MLYYSIFLLLNDTRPKIDQEHITKLFDVITEQLLALASYIHLDNEVFHSIQEDCSVPGIRDPFIQEFGDDLLSFFNSSLADLHHYGKVLINKVFGTFLTLNGIFGIKSKFLEIRGGLNGT
jgi:hypothetical protein